MILFSTVSRCTTEGGIIDKHDMQNQHAGHGRLVPGTRNTDRVRPPGVKIYIIHCLPLAPSPPSQTAAQTTTDHRRVMDVNMKHTAEYIHRVIIMMTRDWHVVVQVIIVYVITIIIIVV